MNPSAYPKARRYSTSALSGDVVRLVSGTAGAQAITLFAAPILTRIFTPTDYGVAAVFAGIAGMISVAACFRYEMAIVLCTRQSEALNLLTLCLLILSGFSALIWILSISVLPSVLPLFGLGSQCSTVWMLPIAVFSTGLGSILAFWLTRVRSFSVMALAAFLAAVVGVIASIGMGYGGYRSGSTLISATIISQLVSNFCLLLVVHRDILLGIKAANFNGLVAVAKRYKKFPLFSSGGAIMNVVSWQLPVLALDAFFSLAAVGAYSLGMRLIQMPMRLVGKSLSQVFLHRATNVSPGKDLGELVRSVFAQLLSITLFPTMVLMFSARQIFDTCFGESWAQAGVFVQILSPWALVWFISAPLSNIYVALEHQKQEFQIHLVILVSRIIAIVIGCIFGSVWLLLGLLAIGGVGAYGFLILRVFRYSNLCLMQVWQDNKVTVGYAFLLSMPVAILATGAFPLTLLYLALATTAAVFTCQLVSSYSFGVQEKFE